MSKKPGNYTHNNNTLSVTLDILAIVAGFVLASVFVDRSVFRTAVTPGELFGCISYVLCTLVIFSGFEMYSVILFRFRETMVTVFLSCAYSVVITIALYALVFQSAQFIGFIAVGALCSFLILLFWRETLFFYYLCKRNKPKLLIIEKIKSDNSRIRRMKYACLDKFQSWYEQVDVEDVEAVRKLIANEFPKYDAICLMESIPADTREMIQRAISDMSKEFYVVPTMYELSFSRVRLTLFDDVMVFHINPNEISRTARFFKRIIDIVCSLVFLAIAAIPMGIIALCIKLTSPGPVFYKQVRLTRGKREFNILKFRSMVANAEQMTGPTLATKDDPRITKVGRILRATRMDELPQLINILKGDMSMVGPRPERPFFVEQYSKEIPNYDARFMVKAGLTSLSHVYGKYATDIGDRTLYDLMYLKQYSLLLDLRILLQTSRIIFISEAAEGGQKIESHGNPTASRDFPE